LHRQLIYSQRRKFYFSAPEETTTMKRNYRTRSHYKARLNLRIEQLEAREMMAADTEATDMSLAANAVPAAVTAPLAATSDATPTATAARVSGIIIPVSSAEPRSIDGANNNLANPELGSVGEQLLRVSNPDYADGISAPAGADRPSARAISNALVAQDPATEPNEREVSAFIYVWGQFIDHDMDLTEPPETGREALPIAVPADDALFDPNGTGTQVIRFNRSRFDESTGTSTDNPREQFNQITSWIDGSMVYGSDQATADSLRSFVSGKLLVSDGNLPPTDEAGDFLAGDTRANENIELTSMHALFVREHNWWAGQIARQNPGLTDEQIYQQARAIVIAEIQSITYNEFLPALLGADVLSDYQGYDATVDPSIANEFSTAAFRMHTLINDDVEFFGNDGRAVRDEITLAEAFNNPDLLREAGADVILKYLASTHAQEFDLQVVDSLRNFLFGQPGQGGLDLASLNIQRGRDHGLADYNSVREAYGLARVTSFAEISSDPAIQQTLEAAYGSVDNIDLWVGGLAEDHLPGASVGELVQTIVADQFERLRDGDRFWYQNIFSGRQLRQIENTSLSDVISRNSTITNLQEDVFFLKSEIRGQVYVDSNANGRQDRRENGLGGVTIELLDDEGAVIDTARTNGRGQYSFDTFHETGDYRVRVIVPNRLLATSSAVRDVLISRGDQTVSVNFALRSSGRQTSPTPPRATTPKDQQAAAVDAVFAASPTVDPLAGMDDATIARARRGRPR
jgi:peroxidase